MRHPNSSPPAEPLALALETSGRIGSVALARGGQILEERSFSHGLMHAAQVVPLIDRLLAGCGQRAVEIGQIFFSAGPGSFTGLRIGVTLAKTLAFVTGAKITPVPTLRVLAENAPAEARHLVVVLDAKRGQIYTARYQRDQTGWTEVETAHLDTLAGMIARAPRPVHLLGEGLPYHRKTLPGGEDSILQIPADRWRASASAVARLGQALADQGCFADADTLEPLYIRPPEAEEKWDNAHR